MKLAIVLTAALLIQGCASSPNVQVNCEQQGDSQYFHCDKYPWWKSQCNSAVK